MELNFLCKSACGRCQNQTAARTAQGFMRGRGHHVGEWNRVRVLAGGDQPRDVRHVDEQVRADRIGDGAKARPIDDTRIGRESRDDHLGTMLLCETLHLIVVDDAGLRNDPVLDRFEELAREIDLGAMGQMTAMIEAHP